MYFSNIALDPAPLLLLRLTAALIRISNIFCGITARVSYRSAVHFVSLLAKDANVVATSVVGQLRALRSSCSKGGEKEAEKSDGLHICRKA